MKSCKSGYCKSGNNIASMYSQARGYESSTRGAYDSISDAYGISKSDLRNVLAYDVYQKRNSGMSVKDIAQHYGLSKTSVYNYLKKGKNYEKNIRKYEEPGHDNIERKVGEIESAGGKAEVISYVKRGEKSQYGRKPKQSSYLKKALNYVGKPLAAAAALAYVSTASFGNTAFAGLQNVTGKGDKQCKLVLSNERKGLVATLDGKGAKSDKESRACYYEHYTGKDYPFPCNYKENIELLGIIRDKSKEELDNVLAGNCEVTQPVPILEDEIKEVKKVVDECCGNLPEPVVVDHARKPWRLNEFGRYNSKLKNAGDWAINAGYWATGVSGIFDQRDKARGDHDIEENAVVNSFGNELGRIASSDLKKVRMSDGTEHLFSVATSLEGRQPGIAVVREPGKTKIEFYTDAKKSSFDNVRNRDNKNIIDVDYMDKLAKEVSDGSRRIMAYDENCDGKIDTVVTFPKTLEESVDVKSDTKNCFAAYGKMDRDFGRFLFNATLLGVGVAASNIGGGAEIIEECTPITPPGPQPG